jgi:hypothetical protein
LEGEEARHGQETDNSDDDGRGGGRLGAGLIERSCEHVCSLPTKGFAYPPAVNVSIHKGGGERSIC